MAFYFNFRYQLVSIKKAQGEEDNSFIDKKTAPCSIKSKAAYLGN